MNAVSKELTITARATAIIDPIKADLPFALPATVTPERFRTVFVTAVMNNPDIITKGTPDSLRRELLKCASDGLLPDGRQAALVPYKGQIKYMPMVQGIIARSRELGDTMSITAECVYKNDVFEADRADQNSTRHIAPPLDEDRGAIIGAYAIFRDGKGSVIHREIMTRSDLDRIKSASSTKDGSVWAKWEGEMARKSAIRRGSKYVPLSSTMRTIVNRDDDMVELNPARPAAIANPLAPPPEDIQPAPLLERLADAIALCTTPQELKDIEESYDAELSEASDSEKDAARLALNAKSKQLAAEESDRAARRADDEALSKSVTDELRSQTELAAIITYAASVKDKVAALPADLRNPIYALYSDLKGKLSGDAA